MRHPGMSTTTALHTLLTSQVYHAQVSLSVNSKLEDYESRLKEPASAG